MWWWLLIITIQMMKERLREWLTPIRLRIFMKTKEKMKVLKKTLMLTLINNSLIEKAGRGINRKGLWTWRILRLKLKKVELMREKWSRYLEENSHLGLLPLIGSIKRLLLRSFTRIQRNTCQRRQIQV
jgi:hypothetical protein